MKNQTHTATMLRPVYARQAITTAFLAPTNTKGPRIKAFCDAGSLTIDFPDFPENDSLTAAHTQVAMDLAQKLGWVGTWVIGSSKNARGYVFSMIDQDSKAFEIKAAE
jgi:hypothetical protein